MFFVRVIRVAVKMAQGYLTHFLGKKAAVFSAGVEPHGINPFAVKAMADDGIDISHHTSDHVDSYLSANLDYILTVCDHANETCPTIPVKGKRLHHSFDDPSALDLQGEIRDAAYAKCRDEIKKYCRELADAIDTADCEPKT